MWRNWRSSDGESEGQGDMRKRSEALIRKAIEVPSQTKSQETLFDLPPDWRQHWWGMPEFTLENASPQHQVIISFLTYQDVKEFARVTGLQLTDKSKSAWFPTRKRLEAGKYFYDGPKQNSKYPICIPSKGRASLQTTGRQLDLLGVSHLFFVEDCEYEQYVQALGSQRVVKMPFSNLGQGSIPARNFIWDWARRNGHARHWCLDDNIEHFCRDNLNRKLLVRGGAFFRAMEDFVDRFTNVRLAGPNSRQFGGDSTSSQRPAFILNSRVYSCILIDTSMDLRWRGRYNEDTDLSLRVLKMGDCTVLFNAMRIHKASTVGAKDAKPMPGGNTDNVYNTGDFRRAFAESLRDQHPDVVSVVWKFNRWHHQVDYSPFKRNALIYRSGIVKRADGNDYGMRLTEALEDSSSESLESMSEGDIA